LHYIFPFFFSKKGFRKIKIKDIKYFFPNMHYKLSRIWKRKLILFIYLLFFFKCITFFFKKKNFKEMWSCIRPCNIKRKIKIKFHLLIYPHDIKKNNNNKVFKIVSFIHSFFLFLKLKIKDCIHAYIIYTKNHKRNRDSFIHAFT